MACSPAANASLRYGSPSMVATTSPARNGGSRNVPISLSVTSSRARPSFSSATTVVSSLSDPALLMPTAPPLIWSALVKPAAVNSVLRITLLSEPIVMVLNPAALARTTDDMPICISWIRPSLSAGPVSEPPIIFTMSKSSPYSSYSPAACAIQMAKNVLAGDASPTLKGIGGVAIIWLPVLFFAGNYVAADAQTVNDSLWL